MAVTREQIRTRARIAADQDKSQFPTDAQYNLIIDDCGRQIYGDLVQAGWPAIRTKESVTLTGADSYSFGATVDVLTTTLVMLMSGTSPVAELKPFDESRTVNMLTSAGAYPQWYRVSVDPDPSTGGNKLEVFPPLASGYSVTLHYVKGWPGFTSDTQSWRGPTGSDALIVLMAAAAGARKEGETADAQALDQQYQLLWNRVIERASWMDGRNAPKIREVENMQDRDPFDFNVSNRGW